MSGKIPECWAINPINHRLRVELSPRHSIILPFESFAFSEYEAGNDLDSFKLVFSTHKVVLYGQALQRIENAVHNRELSLVTTVPMRYRPLMDGQPFIERIEVLPVDTVLAVPKTDPIVKPEASNGNGH